MGGRSKKKSSSNTQQQTAQTMSQLADGKTSNEELMGDQQAMQASMLGTMFPAFGAMVQDGMRSFSQNPMAPFIGAAMGQPIEVQTPEFLSAFIDKYKADQEPVAPTPVEQAPFDINQDMQQRFGMGYSPYGTNYNAGLFRGLDGNGIHI